MTGPEGHTTNILPHSNRQFIQNADIRAAGGNMNNHTHGTTLNIFIGAGSPWSGHEIPPVQTSEASFPTPLSAHNMPFPPEDSPNIIHPISADGEAKIQRQDSVQSGRSSDPNLEQRRVPISSPRAGDNGQRQDRPPLHLQIPPPFESATFQPPNLSAPVSKQKMRRDHPPPLSTPMPEDVHHWREGAPGGSVNDTQFLPHREFNPEGISGGSAATSPELSAVPDPNSTSPRPRRRQILNVPDLTGQVQVRRERTGIIGSYNKIDIGVWLDRMQVAVRRPKTLPDGRDVYNRFRREVSLWATFDHPNLLALCGVADIQGHLCAVSPWMANDTAIEFVKMNSEVDVVKILSEVAEDLVATIAENRVGLAYLHMRNVLHGDLRGSNILISMDGVARLSDFRLSRRTVADSNEDLPRPPINPRWYAPEISVCEKPPVLSKQSDIWSLGMLFLELQSGERPFSEMSHDSEVLYAHTKGILPKRPTSPTAIKSGLNDEMWSLLQGCWNKPGSRPGIEEVQRSVALIREGSGGNKPRSLIFSLGTKSSSDSSKRATVDSVKSRNSSLSSFGNWMAPESPVTSCGPSITRFPSPLDMPREPNLHLTHLGRTPSSVSGVTTRPGTARSGSQIAASTSGQDGHTIGYDGEDAHLRRAISEWNNLAYANTSGALAAGTLEGLVDRLVDDIGLYKNREFSEVIITACIDFTTPEDLCAMLQARFHGAERDGHRQINVFEVMSYWMTQPQLPVSPDLLSNMQEFCRTTLEVKSSRNMVNKAQYLLHLVEIRSKRDAGSRTILMPSGRMLTPDNITPHGLAVAMSLLEGDKFKLITPSDYLAHLCNHSGSTNVDAAHAVNEKIVIWVKQSLVHYEALNPRVSVFKFFINTASECRKLRNYQSLLAIARSLNSPEIRSLELTTQSLGKNEASQLKSLLKLCSPNQDYYREALREVLDPAYRNYCIPWIDVHIEDLRPVLYFNKRVIGVGGQTVINLQGYSEFLSRVKEAFPLPPPDLEGYRNQGQLAYLEAKLADVKTGKEAKDELSARTRHLKAMEVRIAALRLKERQNLGFSTPKGLQSKVTG